MKRYSLAISGALALLLGASALPATARTFTLPAAADTFLRDGAENRNNGGDAVLQLSGNHRVLLRVDQSAVASAVGSGRLVSASLELYVRSANGWGADGKSVEIHRLTANWTETGATWNCAIDTQPTNSKPDCATQWEGGTFEEDSSDTVTHTNDERRRVQFDVTADVAAFLTGTANQGWLLKREEEAGAGRVDYASREGVAAERPRLVLLVETAANDQVPPSLAITSPVRSILVNEPSPAVTLQYADGGSGVDTATLQVLMDGEDFTSTCTVGASSATCQPASLASGNHSIQARLRDQAGNQAQTSFSFQLLVGEGPHLVVFQAVADTYLRKGEANRNFGAEPILRLRQGGQNRSLVRFDPQSLSTALSGATLVSASLELHIEKNGRNWGKQGRTVDAHWMTAAWTETGATWNCASDSNTPNGQPDCAGQWNGGSFTAAPTASVLHTRDLAGWVSFDVTADVAAFISGTPNQGWLIKKTDEKKSGRVDYDSRQGTAGERPRLAVVFTTAGGGGGGDTTAPFLSFVSPSGRIVAGAPPEISLIYSDDASGIDPATLAVVVDGAGAATCTPGPEAATCALTTLPTGSHRLTAQVRDRAGNSGTALRDFSFVLDLLPPVVAVTAPAANALLNEGIVLVEGTATDESVISLTINGQPAGVSAGRFSSFVNLPEGSGELRVAAVDEADRQSAATVLIFVDSRAPSLTVETPRPGQRTNRDFVAVTGRAEDENGVARVEIGGIEVPVNGGRFEREIDLQEGTNAITVRALDAAGNAGKQTLQVVRFTLPSVEIQSPEDLAYIGSATVEVQGFVSDPGAVVTVNGIVAAVAGNAFLAQDVPLIEGGNILTATAQTPQGRVGTDSINVVRDLTAPKVVVQYPREGALLAGESVDVSGMVNDIVAGTVNASEATVTVNGQPAAVANRSFFVAGMPLQPGENVLAVVATDASGNVGRTEVRVLRDATAVPRVVVVSGNRQTGVIGSALPQPLVVELRDASGQSVAGQPVLFKVAGSDGTLDGGKRQVAVTSGPDGRAQTRFTLGTRSGVGNQAVEAVVSRFRGAVFTATALPGPATKIVTDAGDQQLGVTGHALPRPLVATVTDAGFNRLDGVTVRFQVVQGLGQFQNHLQEITVETDSDGRAIVPFILDPQERTDASVVQAVIDGLDESPLATFVSYGRTAGEPAQTAITGLVVDNSNLPLAGVTLRILDTAITAQTDAKGLFRIQPAPVGTVKLIVDGSTVARLGSWPDLEFVMTTVPGRDNDLGMPIYLLPLDLANGVVLDETRGGTVRLPDVPGFALEILPGSVSFPNGSKSGVVSVTAVHGDKVPMVPNFGQQPRLIVTIQPAGARFDPPARLTLPNVEGLAPGQVTEMYSFDHDLGHFVSIGPATVSNDGLVIVSNPGVGILKAGWHCGGNPSTAGTPNACPSCQICNGSTCTPGCAVSSAPSVAADDALASIFKAGCNCDDGNKCTINDNCDSGQCKGVPVVVNKVDGACVAAEGQTVSFTAASNAPDPSVLDWFAAGGQPASGTGGSFSVRYSGEGEYPVTAFCGPKSNTQSKLVVVADDCASIQAKLEQPEVPRVPTPRNGNQSYGTFREGTRRKAKYLPCVDGGKWCFRLQEYLEEHQFGVLSEARINNLNRIVITGANDPNISPGNCAQVIRDLTPVFVPSTYPQGERMAPYSRYVPRYILEAHERFHANDFSEKVTRPIFEALDNFVRQSAHCTDCRSATPTARFNQEMNRLWAVNRRKYFNGRHEARAFQVENTMLADLVTQIRDRARNAPSGENWPNACK
jgi:hypothetical protein